MRSQVTLATQGYCNTKEDVRFAAYALLMELYRSLSKLDMMEQLSQASLRKAQLDHIMKGFAQIE